MARLKKFRHSLTASLSKFFIRGVAILSLKNCHRVGSAIGWLLTVIPNRNLFITKINVRLCFPQMDKKQQQQLVNKSLIEMGKSIAEISPMWQWDKQRLFQSIKKIEGEELLHQAIGKGKGVIIAAPHLGCWELLGHYLADKYPTTCMYQKPKVAQLDPVIRHGRQRLGVKLVATDNQGIRSMLKSIKNNEVVCILPDQEPNEGNGVYVPFFGIEAYSMVLISRLAKKTGATVLSIYGKRLEHGEGYEIVFKPLEKIHEGTLEDSVAYLNAEIEKLARELPEQYQWSYKRFRKLSPEKIARGIVHDPYFH